MGWRCTSATIAVLLLFAPGCPPLILDLGGDDDTSAGDDDDTDDDDDTGSTDDDSAGEGPAVQLVPSYWVFEDHPVGCEQQVLIEVHSVGTEPLEIHDIAFSTSNDDLWHAFDPVADELPPGACVPITVTYSPTDESPDTATLAVISNDPQIPTIEAVLIGTAHYGEAVMDEFEGDGVTASFTLGQQAVPSSIQVQQNGVPVYSGWGYSAEENAVVFEPGHVPDDGDQIVVEYHLPGIC